MLGERDARGKLEGREGKGRETGAIEDRIKIERRGKGELRICC